MVVVRNQPTIGGVFKSVYMVVMCLVYELVCCVSLCMCVSAVAAVSMVFHCDPIFGSVCHGPGWHSLFWVFEFDF